MRRIFYLTCALIVFGSLYPFHFVLRDSPAGAIQAFRASLDFVLNAPERSRDAGVRSPSPVKTRKASR